MNIISASNPQWANFDQTALNLDVEVTGLGVIPFTASPNDVEAHGRALFAQAVVGDFGAIMPKPPKTPAEIAADESAAALRALEKIDGDSIRLIREYISAKADAPRALKDLETAAIGERVKVRV